MSMNCLRHSIEIDPVDENRRCVSQNKCSLEYFLASNARAWLIGFYFLIDLLELQSLRTLLILFAGFTIEEKSKLTPKHYFRRRRGGGGGRIERPE